MEKFLKFLKIFIFLGLFSRISRSYLNWLLRYGNIVKSTPLSKQISEITKICVFDYFSSKFIFSNFSLLLNTSAKILSDVLISLIFFNFSGGGDFLKVYAYVIICICFCYVMLCFLVYAYVIRCNFYMNFHALRFHSLALRWLWVSQINSFTYTHRQSHTYICMSVCDNVCVYINIYSEICLILYTRVCVCALIKSSFW